MTTSALDMAQEALVQAALELVDCAFENEWRHPNLLAVKEAVAQYRAVMEVYHKDMWPFTGWNAKKAAPPRKKPTYSGPRVHWKGDAACGRLWSGVEGATVALVDCGAIYPIRAITTTDVNGDYDFTAVAHTKDYDILITVGATQWHPLCPHKTK